ncbi:hypothetical protein RRG08_041824 [Elysia crispata]|uniref:Uncharacterized protein n=1 Tax=Elysia crispata TaxID=231223 RepID=A0AAE1CQM1_9GAST|nr:hypothetical protein RRG08_041824 [Elysia crispata]
MIALLPCSELSNKHRPCESTFKQTIKMILQVLTVVLIAVTQTQGNYNIYNNRQRRSAQCSSSAEPCRLMFEELHPNGTLMYRSAFQQLCSCSCNQGPCSNDWTNRNKIISRRMPSDTITANLHMMFCRAITPARVCSNNEVSVEVSGYLEIPNDLELYRCRCRNRSKPLLLKQRYIENYRFHHNYVCEDSWPTCGPSDRCMTVTSTQSTYHCECPSDKRCRFDETLDVFYTEQAVYCSSR